MTTSTRAAIENYTVQKIGGFTPARIEAERELDAHGVHLPVRQRSVWQQARAFNDSTLLVARDADGAPVGALSTSSTRSRALPKHRIYRVVRWSGSGVERADDALLDALAHLYRRDPLCLRASVDLFSLGPGSRDRHARRLAGLGFTRSTAPQMYTQTLTIGLEPSEAELFAALHATARRHIRAPAKKGLALRTVTDPSLGQRLAWLFEETFRRTATVPEHMPWRRIIELSVEMPSVYRVVGLYDDAVSGPESLLAFAWGTVDGDHATYDAGASARRPDMGNTPLSYAPLWDLIAWARRDTAARVFDLGGVTSGGPNDARQGIAEFKRYFSETVVQVAEEWIVEPAPLRSALARTISRGLQSASTLGGRARSALRNVGGARAAQPRSDR